MSQVSLADTQFEKNFTTLNGHREVRNSRSYGHSRKWRLNMSHRMRVHIRSICARNKTHLEAHTFFFIKIIYQKKKPSQNWATNHTCGNPASFAYLP